MIDQSSTQVANEITEGRVACPVGGKLRNIVRIRQVARLASSYPGQHFGTEADELQ